MERPMLRTAFFITLSLTLATPAVAQLSVTLPLNPDAGVESVSYTCEGGDALSFAVRYVNSGADSLAVVPIDGADRIFVNVIAASGARYVAGEFEWWVKGDSATLTNQMDDAATRTCTAAD